MLLNDDVEVVNTGWMDQLVAIAQEADVGAVGAKLLFEDATIQHAGHMLRGREIEHVGLKEPNVPMGNLLNFVDREVSGVTAACLAVRREVWEHLGGFDETLPNNFNDVDFCQRLRAKGYRVVQANSVVLRHFESRTRKPSTEVWEVERILRRLGASSDTKDNFSPEGRPRRNLGEWLRVSAEVWRKEGTRSFMEKASRRVRGSDECASRPAGRTR